MPNVDLDYACDLLLLWGATSASIYNKTDDDSLDNTWFDEPGEPRWEAWDQPVLVAVTSLDQDSRILADSLKNEFNLSFAPSFKESIIENIDWVRETQKIEKPISISDQLWIIPTGQKPLNKHVTNIFMDPGISFGSGTHPTTQMCLEWLSENIKGGESLLDYGCGSGILAIGGKKLGAELAVGVDIDPVCLSSTTKNGGINNVSIPTYLPEHQPKNYEYDILVANILSKPLIELIPFFFSQLKDQGQIVISGITESQISKIINAYESHFSNLELRVKSGWALISGSKTSLN